MSEPGLNVNEKYVGEKDEQGHPNGKGVLTTRDKNDNSIYKIEEGIWKSVVRGSRVDVVVEVMMVDDIA